MPKRSKVEALPKELKEWLDGELLARGFADYVALAKDLQVKGAAVSKSSLHRYGSKFEERMAQLTVSVEQAKALVSASPDDEGAMSEALIRLTQDKLFQILVELEVDPAKVNLSSLTKSIAELARSSVGQKKWQMEMRAKAAEKMRVLESEAKAMKGETRDVALAMLEKVRSIYESGM